jgi:hypothetical protein
MSNDWYKIKQEQSNWEEAVNFYSYWTNILPTLTMEITINYCKKRIEELEIKYPQLKQ